MSGSDPFEDDIFNDAQGSPLSQEGETLDDDIFGGLEDDMSSGEKSKNGVVTIRRKAYAVGLNWYSATEDPSKLNKEARAAAQADDASPEFFCVRKTTGLQYGLGFSKLGHKGGQRVLASALTEAIDGNWIGVFMIDADYYLVAVREGIILSECDRLFHKEEEARNFFGTLYNSADWETVYCPGSWGIDEAEIRPLDEILSEKTDKVRLSLVNPTGHYLKIFAVLAVLAGVGFGVIKALEIYEAKKLEDLVEQRKIPAGLQQALDAVEDKVAPVVGLEERDKTVQPETPPPPPWRGKANGLGVMVACTEAILEAPIDVPGWETISVNCDQRNLRISLRKNGGNVAWAERYFHQAGMTDLDLRTDVDASALSIRKKAPFVSEMPATLQTVELEKIRRHLQFGFAEIFEDISWAEAPVNPENIMDRYFKRATFDFTTMHPPRAFIRYFEDVPAFSIDQIRYSNMDQTWQVQGTAFEKREIPLPRPEEPEQQ